MNRLWIRVSLALVFVVWLGLGLVVLVVQNATEAGFRLYVNQRESGTFSAQQVSRLEAYYARSGSWVGVEEILTGQGQGQGNADRRGAQILIADDTGRVVAAADPALVDTLLPTDALAQAHALRVNGEQVGWLYRQTPGDEIWGAAENAFLTQMNRQLVIAASGATLVAIIAGGLLAWVLARPLKLLTAATQDLATGQLGRQVKIHGTAETDQLAAAFNAMSRQLEQKEQQRQGIAADVAHELRTPVSVLRGHLEAMMDGLYPMDGAHLAVAYDQTVHLARLVEDLRLLTQAEAGRLPLSPSPVRPAELVEQAVARFEPLAQDAGIGLHYEVETGLSTLSVDASRIRQVLDNLLTNALRHTEPGGHIWLKVSSTAGGIAFQVANTGHLPTAYAEHVFDRFWRADQQRDTSGSGLGLAISRQLVRLHGGTIRVEQQADRTVFTFVLPV